MDFFLFFLVVLLLIGFTLTNGFMVGGSLVSAVITTRALEPLPALACVAACEMAGVFLFGQAVVRLMGQQLVLLPATPHSLLLVLMAALVGALSCIFIFWKMALPSSTGHALVGGLMGAFCGGYGLDHVHWDVFFHLFILLGLMPILGFIAGYGLSFLGKRVGGFLTPGWGKPVRFVQILTLLGASLAHGSNDAQKALAIWALALAALHGTGSGLVWMPGGAHLQNPAPGLLCGVTLAVGLLFGSRRIIQSLGRKLYRLAPLEGACAQTSTMILMGVSSLAGYPMSTSQIMSTSILGVGAAVHPRGVRWELAADIATGWLVTLPAAAAVSALLGLGVRFFHVVP